MTEKTLRELEEQHQVGVSAKGPSNLPDYDRIFSSHREKPVNFLEIGIQDESSLLFWSEYFPVSSKIVGSGIALASSNLARMSVGVWIVAGDENTDEVENRIAAISPAFDLIIDSGLRISGDAIRTFIRYFGRIADGGAFVAANLNCSYSALHEDGVPDWSSPIYFYKQLGDITNHAHWGVLASRKDILASFMRKHDIDIEEDLLASIHSVEFFNATCVIRRVFSPNFESGVNSTANTNDAMIGGMEKLPGMRLPEDEFDAATKKLAEQSARFELLRSMHTASISKLEKIETRLRAALRELDRLKQQNESVMDFARADGLQVDDVPSALLAYQRKISEMQRQSDASFASASWRLTAPLRWSAHQMQRVSRTFKIIPLAIQKYGGATGAFRRFLEIFRASGFHGIRSSASNFEAEVIAPRLSEEAVRVSEGERTYSDWLRLYDPDPVDEKTRAKMWLRIRTMKAPPLVSILMSTSGANAAWLQDAIESVRHQIYSRWELCISVAAPSAEIQELLARHAASEPRIKVVCRTEPESAAEVLNRALALASGSWVAILDHRDRLSEHALFWIANCIDRNPDAQFVYSDEDKIDENGVRIAPNFKPDWNRDLLYSRNVFSHLGVFRSDLVKSVDGFHSFAEDAHDLDLLLRCMERISQSQILHVPRVLYHVRARNENNSGTFQFPLENFDAGERVINAHFARINLDAKAEHAGSGYRIRYSLPSVLPLVSLIIPTRNGLELLRQCIDSIVGKTAYGNYEIIIVDNSSDDQKTLDYLASFQNSALVRVIRDDQEFNYSALNNLAVSQARGEVLGLINNDIEVVSPDWLTEMVSLALQPGVGAVGAKLWYPDRTIQHAGVILGIGGIAGHGHKGFSEESAGYFGRAKYMQSLSAVTAACLVVKKDAYLSVDGLDQLNLKVAFNDVDFCLRLGEKGYRNVWTPYAELVHHESATRGADTAPAKQERFTREVNYMRERWGTLLNADPAYSPNLTVVADDFSYAWPPRVELLSVAHRQ